MKKNIFNKKLYKVTIIIFSISNILIATGFTLEAYEEKKHIIEQAITYSQARKYCDSLFGEGILNDYVDNRQLNSCISKINKIDDQEKVKDIKNNCNKANNYLSLNEKIDSYYNNGIVKSSITLDDINKLKTNNLKLKKQYQDKINNRINDLETNYNNIINTKDNIKKLYTDFNNKIVKSNITRKDYDDSLKLYNSLKQEDIKAQLKPFLDIVLKELEKNEAYEKQKKEAINNSWVKLNVPYISQNENNVMNGCEAASLLMALKYKGYLSNTNLREYAELMPKTDNPNTGFYLDIWGVEPTNISHWIAPEPLKKFGIESSGNNNIINATGYSLDQLGQEIVNNNPVIIYMTSMFKAPHDWSNGAPVNLHVQLLIGYNTMTGDVIILDPWKYKTKSSYWTLSKKNAESIYNQVGKRAVIIK